MAEYNMAMLLHPPFENDPPVKFNVPAKILGLVYAIIAALAFLGGLFGLLFGGLATVFGLMGGNPLAILHVVSSIINLIAVGAIAYGGYKMYQEDPSGKPLVIYGLAGIILAALVGALATPNPFSIIFGLFAAVVTACIVFVAYYLVIISRFTGEQPLASGSGGYTGGTPPPSA